MILHLSFQISTAFCVRGHPVLSFPCFVSLAFCAGSVVSGSDSAPFIISPFICISDFLVVVCKGVERVLLIQDTVRLTDVIMGVKTKKYIQWVIAGHKKP